MWFEFDCHAVTGYEKAVALRDGHHLSRTAAALLFIPVPPAYLKTE